jgi:hypothetical protein
MSTLAKDLIELNALPHGALVEHLLRALAEMLIADGVAKEIGG